MTKIALGLLIGALVFLRITGLSKNPPGFFPDESSTAFNAYSILKTGADEYGEPFPVYFKAFGEYKNPLFIYSQVPSIGLFGLTIEASRLPAAVWGLLAVVFLYLLLKSMKLSKTAILFGVAILLIAPWHFILSRIAFEVIAFPTIFLAALYALHKRSYLAFSLLLGLLFYSYTSARVLAPIYFFLAWFLNKKTMSLKYVPVFLITLLPAFLWEQAHPGSLSARYETVALMNYSKNIFDFGIKFITNYFSHFTPEFLISRGDGIVRHSLSWHSIFFWTTIPLLIIGVLKTFTDRRHSFNKFLLFALLISLVPSALTIQSPHILRGIAFPTLAIVLIAVGVNFIFLKNKTVFQIITCLFVVETVLAIIFFQTNYKTLSRPWFEADAVEFIERTHQLPPNPYPGTEATIKFFEAN